MKIDEKVKKLKHLITCLKCEVSGKPCDVNCPTQYNAGNMGEIIENLEEIAKALEQEPCEDAISLADVFEIMGNLMSIPYDFDRNITEKDITESMDKIRELPRVTPQEPRWIPVTEKLPLHTGRYLVTVVENRICCIARYTVTALYVHSMKKWITDDEANNEDVVAWQKLPKPYKESEGV